MVTGTASGQASRRKPRQTFDAIVLADPRFSGGSTAALIADVTAMAACGLTIGLVFVRSGYLDDSRDPTNPNALALMDLDGVTQLSARHDARAELAFLHHPMVFSSGIEERPRLSARRAVIVTHHAPFRADGSLEWDPIATRRRARIETGLNPWFAPISGTVRAQLASFAPLVRQTQADWPNIFDPEDWPIRSDRLQSPNLTIGRHGRADPLKFPATGAEIDAALPASDTVTVRVMGCPDAVLAERGAHPERWEVLPFGAEPVADFLGSLDVFVYHYHPNWLEAFGRTVVEAALCGLPCLVDPRLKPTFGEMAWFCTPPETADALQYLAADARSTRAAAVRFRDLALARFGAASMAARLEALRHDPGSVDRSLVSTSPPRLMRKIAGHYRRSIRG